LFQESIEFLTDFFQEKAVVEGAGASGVAAVLAGLLPELANKK
jgi:hypothetical protein